MFEVLSPSSGRTDRIVKLREYRSVATIRNYVIVEQSSIGLTVFSREREDQDWTARALIGEDVLQLPDIGIEIPSSKSTKTSSFPKVSPLQIGKSRVRPLGGTPPATACFLRWHPPTMSASPADQCGGTKLASLITGFGMRSGLHVRSHLCFARHRPQSRAPA